LPIGETGIPSKTRFGEHRRAVIACNNANQPVARHFININTGNHDISGMEIRALCPISGGNDCAKDMKCALSPNLALSTPMALMTFPHFYPNMALPVKNKPWKFF
jgi:hypothetical protein